MYYKPQKVREQYCNSQCNSSKNILNTGNDSSELDENWLKKKISSDYHDSNVLQIQNMYKCNELSYAKHLLLMYKV